MNFFSAKHLLFFASINAGYMIQAMDHPQINQFEDVAQRNRLDLAICTDYHAKNMKWSPDGAYIAGFGGYPQIRVWNAHTGKCLWSQSPQWEWAGRKPQDAKVSDIEFSPDSKKLMAALRASFTYHGIDQIAVFNVENGKKESYNGYGDSRLSCFSPSSDGKKMFLGSKEDIYVINPQTGEYVKNFAKPCGFTTVLACSDDGTKIACGISVRSNDKGDNVFVLNAKDGKVITSFKHLLKNDYEDSIHSIKFYHGDSSKMIVCSDSSCHLFDLSSGQKIQDFSGEKGLYYRTAIMLNKDNKKLIRTTGLKWCGFKPGSKGHVTVFDTDTGKEIANFEKESVYGATGNADATKIVVSKGEGKFSIYDLKSMYDILDLSKLGLLEIKS